MKIRFIEDPKGRPEYKKGETHEFNGAVEEGYAKKFLARGWAEPVDKDAKGAVEKAAQDAKSAELADAKQKAEYKAEVQAGTRGPNAQGNAAESIPQQASALQSATQK